MSGIGHIALGPQAPSAMDVAVALDLGRSPAKPHDDTLVELYFAAYGRAPDAAGLAYWQGQLDAGMSLARIAESFTHQAEQTSVDAVYHNLFGRPADAAALAHWQHVDLLAMIGGVQGADAVHLQHAVEAYALAQIEIVGLAHG